MKGEENNRDKKWIEEIRKEILENKKIGGRGIKFDFDLTPQEKSMIKDSVLDTCSSLEFAVNLIKLMREINDGSDYYNYNPSSFLAGLKTFRDSPPNSDYWKCAQVAKNNGDLLNKTINLVQPKYLAKSQELKTKIINNLDNWYLDRGGMLREVVGTDQIFRGEKLTPQDYQEVKRTIIEEIKKNPQQWKVEWTTLLPYETEEELKCLFKYTILVSVKNPQRSHFVDGLTTKEREEIAQALKADLPKNNWELEAEQEKQRVLNDPNKWILSPNGKITAMEWLWGHAYDNRRLFSSYDDYNNIFKTGGLKREENPLGSNELNPEQFGEIQQTFLNEIKSSPQDWKIEQEESGLWAIKHKTGRRHYKNISLKDEKQDEWWEQIEKILAGKDNMKDETSKNSKPASNNGLSVKILIGGGIILIGILILAAFLIRKKKKSGSKK